MFYNLLRDLRTVYNIVFPPKRKASQKEALDDFYAPQVEDYDRFREKMLWGRKELVRALIVHGGCRRLTKGLTNLVWVDIGGGTGANLEMMDEHTPIAKFKRIYIVDLCEAMCAAARKRVADRGWTNVEVICADAAEISAKGLPGRLRADLVTFSYSLSMIPSFYKAIDNAYDILADDGFIGVTDFIAPSEHSLASRTFWTAFFDVDGVKLGPERRSYLKHKFLTYYEYQSVGRLPYVPLIKAPWYLWIGTKQKYTPSWQSQMISAPNATALFPSTFLYHQSWEDPDVDAPVLDITSDDTCLTLTSGGCNSLNLLLQGAKRVVSVDINPAQTALLELKAAAIINLDYYDFWLIFGEGHHPEFPRIFSTKLAPYLSQQSRNFWETRLHYFREDRGGLYSRGSMGVISMVVRNLARVLGVSGAISDLVNAHSLDHQRVIFNGIIAKLSFTRLAWIVEKLVKVLFLNKVVAWFAGGVPAAQMDLIASDGIDIIQYCKRVIRGVFNSSYIRGNNYFYYNILTGHYTHDNCPVYLRLENFRALKGGLIYNLRIVNDYFMNALKEKKYDKVVLMDHADWQTMSQTRELARTLYRHTSADPIIIFRSAAKQPPYVEHLRAAGFEVTCLSRIDSQEHFSQKAYMDRVNMYASFWVAKK